MTVAQVLGCAGQSASTVSAGMAQVDASGTDELISPLRQWNKFSIEAVGLAPLTFL